MSNKKVLVTGAAGFLGSHLCDKFIANGYDVIGMDNLVTGSLRNIEHLFPLKEFKESGFLLALASSSPYRVINFVLQKFSLNEFFSVVVSGETVEFGKPHPDIYLHTAMKLGACPEQGRRIEPGECVVIEDSINGVKSAKGAGMLCIAIPDKRLNQRGFQIADLVVDRLDEISVQVIRSLAGKKLT